MYFYSKNIHFVGSKYPTADIYFTEVCEIHISLLEWKESENVHVRLMATEMMTKFLKYWSECSLILAVAFVLNPGYKMKFVEKYFQDIYGKEGAKKQNNRIRDALSDIYAQYASKNPQPLITRRSSLPSASEGGANVIKSNKAKRFASWYESEGLGDMETKSELEQYLDEPLFPLNGSILDWCKVNSPKYPTLSRMARDILAILVTSVPSECAFSTGGRIIDDQRASLDAETVEALLCMEDWLPPLPGGICIS